MDYRKIIKEIGRGKNHARDLDRDTARGLRGSPDELAGAFHFSGRKLLAPCAVLSERPANKATSPGKRRCIAWMLILLYINRCKIAPVILQDSKTFYFAASRQFRRSP